MNEPDLEEAFLAILYPYFVFKFFLKFQYFILLMEKNWSSERQMFHPELDSWPSFQFYNKIWVMSCWFLKIFPAAVP